MNYETYTLEELEQKQSELEREIEYLQMRKMDLSLYQRAYEKHVIERGRLDLVYGKLCNHPDYYTKWRGTFFDTNIRLIESGVFVRYPKEELGKSIAERRRDRTKMVYPKEFYYNINAGNVKKEQVDSAYLYSCGNYETALMGVCKFDSLLWDPANPDKEPVGVDSDMVYHPIVGFCNAIKENNGKYQLHLVDPFGECLFAPFDLTPEEAELALGRICIVNCAYNFFAAEPRLMELQILPFTLTEKLGDYETDTTIIERSPKLNYTPFAYFS